MKARKIMALAWVISCLLSAFPSTALARSFESENQLSDDSVKSEARLKYESLLRGDYRGREMKEKYEELFGDAYSADYMQSYNGYEKIADADFSCIVAPTTMTGHMYIVKQQALDMLRMEGINSNASLKIEHFQNGSYTSIVEYDVADMAAAQAIRGQGSPSMDIAMSVMPPAASIQRAVTPDELQWAEQQKRAS